MNDTLDIRVHAALEPILSFSPARLRELLDHCHIENVSPGQHPFRGRTLHGQSVYLVRGEMELTYADGNKVTMRADSEWARHPIGKRQPDIVAANALSPVRLLRVDDDLLDLMVTWDQFATHDDVRPKIGQDGSEAAVRRRVGARICCWPNSRRATCSVRRRWFRTASAIQRYLQCDRRVEQGDTLHLLLPERAPQRGSRFYPGAGRI